MTKPRSERLRLAVLFTLVVATGLGVAHGIDRAAYAAGTDTATATATLEHDAASPRYALTAPPTVTSPTDAWDAVHQYGYVWGGMIIVFAIGTVIAKKADDDHWVNKDHVLPIITGTLGVIGAALQAKFAGGSWAVVPMTVMGVVTLILQNRPKKSPGSVATATTAAGAAVVVLVALAVSSTQQACGPTITKDLAAAGDAGIDCAKSKFGATVPEVGITVAEDAGQIIAAGKDGYEDALKKLGLSFGSDAVDCGIKMAHAMWTMQAPGAPVAFEKPAHVVRAEKYLAGKKFK